MFVVVWFLMVMKITMMKSDAASAEIITAHSGQAVLMIPHLLEAELEGRDVRWTHLHLVISLKKNLTMCYHRRCELLRNGSLRFSRVQPEDAGNYSLQVFDEGGKRLHKTDFLLRVLDSSSSSSVVVSVLMCFFLLLLFFIILFILMRRRRNQRSRTTGPPQENVYVVMHGNLGNKRKDEEEKQEREEESHYVLSNPVSMETPITRQMSVDVEGIYV